MKVKSPKKNINKVPSTSTSDPLQDVDSISFKTLFKEMRGDSMERFEERAGRIYNNILNIREKLNSINNLNGLELQKLKSTIISLSSVYQDMLLLDKDDFILAEEKKEEFHQNIKLAIASLEKSLPVVDLRISNLDSRENNDNQYCFGLSERQIKILLNGVLSEDKEMAVNVFRINVNSSTFRIIDSMLI